MRTLLRAAAVAAVLVMAGCAHAPAQMYLWDDYPRNVYDYLRGDGADPAAQLQRMTAQADKARIGNRPLPPGFHAHVAMLQIQLGQYDAARAQLEAEKLAFPESGRYMDFLLKNFEEKKS